MFKTPSNNYLALLDIKLVIQQWQDLRLSDGKALDAIGAIIKREQKEWQETHR